VRVGLVVVVVVGSGSGEDPCRYRHTPMAADGTGSPATPVAVGLAPSNTLVSLGDAAARPPLSFSLSPVDIGNRLDARGGYEKRYGIVLDGRLALAAFQRMPSRAEQLARFCARAHREKMALFRCTARTTARVLSPGEEKRKKVRVVATCEQASAGYLVWRVASWVAISTKRCTTAHAHFSVYKQDRTKPLKLFLLGKPSL
jgi:hypothetical protein